MKILVTSFQLRRAAAQPQAKTRPISTAAPTPKYQTHKILFMVVSYEFLDELERLSLASLSRLV
jgi:hypothetical protein